MSTPGLAFSLEMSVHWVLLQVWAILVQATLQPDTHKLLGQPRLYVKHTPTAVNANAGRVGSNVAQLQPLWQSGPLSCTVSSPWARNHHPLSPEEKWQ